MPNASTDACAIGYDLFRTHVANGGDITRQQINAHLMRQGVDTISERTFKHYRKLHAHGFGWYVPINRLDVWAAQP
jgi:hypothetical protein